MNKIAGFFEDHVEKIVLVVVGIISLALLFLFVIKSPNKVEIDGKQFSPSAIDEYINEQAQGLKRQIGEPDSKVDPYEPRLPEFAKLMQSALSDINVQVAKRTALKAGNETFAKGVYRVPDIGDVSDVEINHIRAVAYIPTEQVTIKNDYDKVKKEPNDLDLVSVAAKFDVKKLYKSFRECFLDNVEQMYADPCLAKPIFAKVQLERQQLMDDGTWSQWQEVPRLKIDSDKELFNIGDKVDELPTGGLDVLKVQFGYKQTQIDLLQPLPYQFASAREEWFPPILHAEYAEIQRKDRTEEIRKQREDEKEARQRERDDRSGRRGVTDQYGGGGTLGGGRSRRGGGTTPYGGGITGGSRGRNRSSSRTTTGLPGDTGRQRGGRRGSGRRSTADSQDNMYGPGGMEAGIYGGQGTTQRGPRKETVNDVYLKYSKIALSRLTDFSKIDEPLMFWAHDDTVEPGNIYRYRIRLGVFNPVAGTNKLDERDKSFSDQAILWSGFSDVTDPVEIMKRIYFFANDVREADKSVTVQVSRLTLGHWYSEDFPVRQGALIGESREYKPETPKPKARDRLSTPGLASPVNPVAGAFGTGINQAVGPGVSPNMSGLGVSQDNSNIPEYIDYSTGAMMVDTVPVSDWSPGRIMRSRRYYDMLYSFDGVDILHMPVGRSNWSKELTEVFSTISTLARVPQEPFKSFGSGAARRSTQFNEMGDYGDEMMYEDMVY